MEFKLLTGDEVNANGRKYSRESLSKIVDDFEEKKENFGAVYGELGRPSYLDVSVKNISHVVNSVRFERKNKRIPRKMKKLLKKIGKYGEVTQQSDLYCDIKFLDTDAGRSAMSMIKSLQPQIRAIAKTDENGVIHIEKMLSIDLCQK